MRAIKFQMNKKEIDVLYNTGVDAMKDEAI